MNHSSVWDFMLTDKAAEQMRLQVMKRSSIKYSWICLKTDFKDFFKALASMDNAGKLVNIKPSCVAKKQKL